MSSSKRAQEEELKKLEDQAYFELCQIIAEAMQLQDVNLLNARIASWKNKYKKLLDRPSTNSKSDFKKRIEFLLTQYYSEVTRYILSQLKLNEEKKIQNQAKAMRELYTIIRDTNDYDLLKKKVAKWKEKYPVSSFLKMYQKRIELYTKDKNIRENAFKQEEAFSDLVDITKVHGTLDELKDKLTLWEEKYSINDKYSIDDFLKHQTEVKRYTSDEFLHSIAREEPSPDNADKTHVDVVEQYTNKTFSDLSVQASAYTTLLKISKSPNAVNEMFTWVYKNSHVKFNDKYRELILSATYLEYSPTYLNKLPKPEIDMSKSSLSYDEYKNLTDIKKYAIISYFNLLLPPEKTISNDYFNKHIQTIYAKSESARVSDIEEDSIYIEETLNSGIEIFLEEPDEVITETLEETENPIRTESEEIIVKVSETEDLVNPEVVIDLEEVEPVLTIDLNADKDISDNITIASEPDEAKQFDATPVSEGYQEEAPQIDNDSTDTPSSQNSLSYETVVAFSPLFFEAINNYQKQAVLVNHIDSATTKYVELENAKEVSIDEPTKNYSS